MSFIFIYHPKQADRLHARVIEVLNDIEGQWQESQI